MRTILRLTLALAVIALLPRPAASQLFAGAEAMSSTVFLTGQTSFSGLGARLKLQPFVGTKEFELLPGLEYWRNNSTIDVYDIHAQRRDATLELDARFRLPKEGWTPYAGGGFGVHFLSTNVSAPPLGVIDESHSIMKGAFAALGGVNFPLAGKFETFLEGKYYALADYEQWKLSWGLTFNAQ